MCNLATFSGESGDEARISKVYEDAASECAASNAFNTIVKTNWSSKRAKEGIIVNPPE
jgi:hypothetical protein